MKNTCIICNSELLPSKKSGRKKTKFCSIDCQKKDHLQRLREGLTYTPSNKSCLMCNNTFEAKTYNAVYCSSECRRKGKQSKSTANNRKYRKDFRDKYNIPSSKEFAEFIHHQDLLDNNQYLLETLQLIHKLKHQRATKEENILYMKKYYNRPISYGTTECKECGVTFERTSYKNIYCPNHNRYRKEKMNKILDSEK